MGRRKAIAGLGAVFGIAALYVVGLRSLPSSCDSGSPLPRVCVGTDVDDHDDGKQGESEESQPSFVDDLAGRIYQEIEIYATNPQYDVWQREAAEQHGIDWLLGKAVRIKESHDDPQYVSSVGAVGLMQLMPRERSWIENENYQGYLRARRKSTKVSERVHNGKTYLEWGGLYQQDLLQLVRDVSPDELVQRDRRFDPEYNVFEGTSQLAENIATLNGRFGHERMNLDGVEHPKHVVLAVAAYNAGIGNVRSGKIPRNPQTQRYVTEVFSLYTLMKEKERRELRLRK